MDESIAFDVLFNGNSLPIALPISATILDLKQQLEMYTSVPVNKQMILNLVDVKNDTHIASMDLSNVEMVEVDESVQSSSGNQNPDANATSPSYLPVGQMNIDEPNHQQQQQQNNNINNDSINPHHQFTSDEEDEGDDDNPDDYNISRPYVTSRFATNYFPNTGNNDMSTQALTDLLDQVSYPTFAEDYVNFGLHVPTPFQGTYKETLAEAKKQGKLVLTYLHCPELEECALFCSILAQERIYEFITTNYLFFVGNINETAQMLLFNLIPFERFPVVSIVSNFGSPQVLELIQGINDADDFYSKIINHITSNERELTRLRREEEEKEEQRRIVQDQDLAYEESLKADIEKARLEEITRQKEVEEQRKVEREKQEKLDRIKMVPDEPPKGPTSTHVIFKLPDDSKLERRFNSKDTLKTLTYFLDGSGVELDSYQFITQFPKKVYTPKDFDKTLEETGIHPQSILNVRSNDD